MNSLSVHKGAIAPPGCKFLVASDVEYDACAKYTVPRDAYRYRIFRVAVQKVGSAIKWVGDYNDALTCDHCRRQLFAEHDRIGKTVIDDGDDLALGGFVYLANEIRMSLRLPNQLFALSSGLANHTGSASSRFNRDVEQLGIFTLSC